MGRGDYGLDRSTKALSSVVDGEEEDGGGVVLPEAWGYYRIPDKG